MVISIEAEYEENPDWDYSGPHGHVVVSVGSFTVARIPCRHNSRHFRDGDREEVEDAVCRWLALNLPYTDIGK